MGAERGCIHAMTAYAPDMSATHLPVILLLLVICVLGANAAFG